MGKYLQDIEFRHDVFIKWNELLEQARLISIDLAFIESIFHKHLPKKIEIGNKIWRFIIMLTPIEDKNGKTEIHGLCQDYYAYIDYKKIIELPQNQRQLILLDIFIRGIEKCCEANHFPPDIFQKIDRKVRNEMVQKM